MAGVQNIVAPQGTAFTADHARILKRYVEEVVLCFDSDEAGQNAAVRVARQSAGSGLAVRVAMVPAPHDPDSFIKAIRRRRLPGTHQQGGGLFRLLPESPLRHQRCQDGQRPSAVVRAMAEAVHKTGNVVLLDKYAQKTALRLGVSPDAMRAEFKKGSAARSPVLIFERPSPPKMSAHSGTPVPARSFGS